jgi:hypothetical protein
MVAPDDGRVGSIRMLDRYFLYSSKNVASTSNV